MGDQETCEGKKLMPCYVTSMAEDHVMLEQDIEKQVFHLVNKVAERWQVPVNGVSLAMAGNHKTMKPEERLERYCHREDKGVYLNMQFTLEPTEAQLISSDTLETQVHCMQIISELETLPDPSKARLRFEELVRASDNLVAGVGAFLFHPDEDVSSLARRALIKIARPGDQRVITQLLDRLDAENILMRCQMIDLYSRVVVKADPEALDRMIDRLCHAEWNTRCAAVKALGMIAEKGDAQSIAAICTALEDGQWQVRRAAVDSLDRIAERGDEAANIALRDRLRDRDWTTRATAVQALGHLAEFGDKITIDLLVDCLEDGDADVRSATVVALGSIVGAEDVRALAALGRRLEDVHTQVSDTVLETLAQSQFRGNSVVIASVLDHLNSKDYKVRRLAALLLPKIAVRGDQRVTDALDDITDDKYPDIRYLALVALDEIAAKDDEHTIDAIWARVEDTNSEVKIEAIQVLEDISAHAEHDSHALLALKGFADDVDPLVRDKSLQALGHMADKGDSAALAVLEDHLNDCDAGVRVSAQKALELLKPPTEPQSEDVACTCGSIIKAGETQCGRCGRQRSEVEGRRHSQQKSPIARPPLANPVDGADF
jgi:HEAT repeat protein